MTNIDLETNLKDFVIIVGHKGWKGRIPKRGLGLLQFSVSHCVSVISEYIDSIGDLKKLAVCVEGFANLKDGVSYNDGRVLPYYAMRGFGKKKLEHLNKVLSEYKIEPIPWRTTSYLPWEKRNERGRDWYNNIII